MNRRSSNRRRPARAAWAAWAAPQNGGRLRVVPAGISVMSDPALLGAILRNLVRNALKYTPPGGPARARVAAARPGP
jgi:signal transduction histidine kinase